MLENYSGLIPTTGYVSNQHNPAARHYTGMSAAAGRGMVTRIMRLYEGYGDVYIHGFQVVRSVKIQGIKEYELSLRTPQWKTLFSYRLSYM